MHFISLLEIINKRLQRLAYKLLCTINEEWLYNISIVKTYWCKSTILITI